MLVEIAQERGESIFPSLVYSSTVVNLIGMADVDSSRSRQNNNRSAENYSPLDHELTPTPPPAG